MRSLIKRSTTQLASSWGACRNNSTNTQQSTKATEKKSEPDSKLVQLTNRERSLNMVTLIGRVGRDPSRVEKEKTLSGVSATGEEVKETSTLSVFSMATSEYAGMDVNGQAKFRVDWHRVVVVAERAQNLVQKYVRKGDRIHVTGRLHYNTTRDKNGEPRVVATVLADDFIFLSKNIDPDI